MKSPNLRNLKLLAHALDDPGVQIARRPTDANWEYSRYLGAFSPGGFNPFRRTIYVPQISRVSDWIANPSRDPRELNHGDFLAKEALFLAHDYLHIWATELVSELAPEIGYGTAPITRENAEDFAFCYLFTEAVAVVGLDYWLLCQQDLAEIWQMGTNWARLTISFNRGHLKDLRRMGEGFTPLRPSFLYDLTRFYCDGEFDGVSTEAYVGSATISSWLRHEITYGGSQRMLIRSWLEHLAGTSLGYRASELTAPVSTDGDWKHGVVEACCTRLWKMIVESEYEPLPPPRDKPAWESPEDGFRDWRFCNLATADMELVSDLASDHLSDIQADFVIGQFVYGHRFADLPGGLAPALQALIRARNLGGIIQLFDHAEMPRLEPMDRAADSPRDLFLHP